MWRVSLCCAGLSREGLVAAPPHARSRRLCNIMAPVSNNSHPKPNLPCQPRPESTVSKVARCAVRRREQRGDGVRRWRTDRLIWDARRTQHPDDPRAEFAVGKKPGHAIGHDASPCGAAARWRCASARASPSRPQQYRAVTSARWLVRRPGNLRKAREATITAVSKSHAMICAIARLERKKDNSSSSGLRVCLASHSQRALRHNSSMTEAA